jgi:hypothetical protein
MDGDTWAVVQPSAMAQHTRNPIREIVDVLKPSPNPAKAVIPLSIGAYSCRHDRHY